MTSRGSLILRMLADVLAGVLAIVGFVFASHTPNGVWFIAIFSAVFLASGAAGYMETSAKRVWIHAPLIMSPELIALPIVLLTCHGFECAGFIGFAVFASLFTLILVPVSLAGFYIRRRITQRHSA